MGKIYRYELIRRKNTITIFSGIMLGMTLVSMIISGFFVSNTNIYFGKGHLPFAVSLWISLTVLALCFIPFAMMFLCSSGHTKELLYKNTNYLMLSIPVESWKILLGRFLAGLTEMVIYSVVSTISLVLWLIVLIIKLGEDISKIMNVLFLNMGKNITLILFSLFAVLTFIALLGTVVMFVRTLTRSFIKRKKLAEFLSVILFVMLFILLSQLMNKISNNFNWMVYIDIKAYSIASDGIISTQGKNSIPIPILLPIGYTVLSAVFFSASAWLLKNKVEV